MLIFGHRGGGQGLGKAESTHKKVIAFEIFCLCNPLAYLVMLSTCHASCFTVILCGVRYVSGIYLSVALPWTILQRHIPCIFEES